MLYRKQAVYLKSVFNVDFYQVYKSTRILLDRHFD